MRLLALVLIALLATPTAFAQQLEPKERGPLTVSFVNTAFDVVLGFVGKYAGILIEMDDSATPERRKIKITVRMNDATVEEVLDTITRMAGLSYMVVDAQTIRIYQVP